MCNKDRNDIGGLLLTRQQGQEIVCETAGGEEIVVQVVRSGRRGVRLRVLADRTTNIRRGELPRRPTIAAASIASTPQPAAQAA